MTRSARHISAFRAAFPQTIPILTGFMFLGISYGIFMGALGFKPIYPMLMSLLIFAGSMEFVTANLLLGAFNPLNAFFLTLMLNARHLFYGFSMLERYNNTGKKKYYLIFGMCDESFVINNMAQIPKGVDSGLFMTYVTALNHFYWVLGASIGALSGSFINFDTRGLEFVMTALFVVIFLDQWMKETTHHSSLIGLAASVLALLIFGQTSFILPAMLLILAALTIFKKPIEQAERRAIS